VLTIISSVFFISFSARKAAAPIVNLSKAAKNIAKGNFSIDISPSTRQDEIGDLERDFSLMIQELRSNEIMKKDFITNVSHEFKTPLAIIQGYGKLLADEELTPDERRSYAKKLDRESQRLITLTANILRLSKLESQAITPLVTRFQLDEQIRQAILTMQPTWANRHINFDIDLLPLFFEGDEELLSQVWLNLVDNAIKFSHDKGKISIQMAADADSVKVEISDCGIGMDETTQARIFEQFYQGETSLSKEGSGLGLPIVKRIVDLHQGKISFESYLGTGSRFTVNLPLYSST
jgi:signal transduction histidine kinase